MVLTWEAGSCHLLCGQPAGHSASRQDVTDAAQGADRSRSPRFTWDTSFLLIQFIKLNFKLDNYCLLWDKVFVEELRMTPELKVGEE